MHSNVHTLLPEATMLDIGNVTCAWSSCCTLWVEQQKQSADHILSQNNYIKNPRTAPDLSLRLQRAFWGMLLQIVLDSCDSWMPMRLSELFWQKQDSCNHPIVKCDCQKIMTSLVISFNWIQKPENGSKIWCWQVIVNFWSWFEKMMMKIKWLK